MAERKERVTTHIIPDDHRKVNIGDSTHEFNAIRSASLAADTAAITTVTGNLVGNVTPVVGALTPSNSILVYSSFKTGGTPWFQPDGTNTKDIMDSFTLPGGTLTTGRRLRFTVFGNHTGANTQVATVAITIGGTIAAYQTTLADGTDIASFSADVSGVPFCLTADMYQLEATVQRCYARFNEGFTADILPTNTSLTQDMTADKSFILSLKNVTAVADASIYGWTVELI